MDRNFGGGWFRVLLSFLSGVVVLCADATEGLLSGDGSIRVLSWNVRNYNLTDRFVHDVYCREYPKPEVEKAALRRVIFEQRPDVMLFQEVGGDPYLRELSEDLKEEYGMDYPYFLTLFADDEVRKLGVLARLPFQQKVNPLNQGAKFHYLDDSIPVKRGLLEIDIMLADGRSITCMTYHLKSRFTSDPRDPESGDRREKEARAIRNYLREVLAHEPEKQILMMGDLNDCFSSQAYDRMTQVSGQPVMNELQVVDERGECWTYFYNKERRYEQIDFVFVSPFLKSCSALNIKARIISGESVLQASDHRPIVVDLSRTQ